MDLKLKLFSLFFFLMSAQLLIAQQEKIWENTNFDFESDHISQFSQIQLNSALFLETLARAPKEFTAAARNNPLTIEFPMPDQSVLHFNVFESPIMAPSLAAKYPHFKTWCGQGVEDKTAIIRFDWTDKGLHAFIHSVNGTFLIDPVDLNNDYYISYNKKDLINTNYTGHFCNHEQTSLQNSIEQVGIQNRSVSVGEVLKTYRFAVATTGEYASFHGGTVPSVLSSIVTAVNRINQIFENEMSIRFELIPETESLIYLDSDTDPYTDGESLDMLIENIGNVPPIIGNDAFDVGHVFGTGGGGIANLGNICNDDEKAGGVTAVSPPTGDFFSVQYCCHELGHQFSANHTWSNCTEDLNGSQLSSGTAVEPGSGSTIMSYAGLCSGNLNITSSSDDYFNGRSLQEMINLTSFSCAIETATGNTPPDVDPGIGQNLYIPASTPFELTAIAVDQEGDELTYCWEQSNLGPISPLGDPIGTTPTFRSFKPTLSPTRSFPRFADLITGNNSIKEVLPTYNRNLSFVVTVRDNHAGAGGITQEEISFNATDFAGPFLVNTPIQSEIVTGGSDYLIEWDVANTDVAPISSPKVDIYFSSDNAQNFELIAENVNNNGSFTITMPEINTGSARIKVKGRNHIFFNYSKKFKIETIINTKEIENKLTVSIYPNPAVDLVNIDIQNNDVDDIEIALYSIHGKLIYKDLVKNAQEVYQLHTNNIIDGTYLVKLSSQTKTFTKKITIRK